MALGKKLETLKFVDKRRCPVEEEKVVNRFKNSTHWKLAVLNVI